MTKNNIGFKLLREHSKVSAIIFLLLTIIVITSCHKREGLGNGIIPEEDYYNHKELVFSNFSSETFIDTTIITDESACAINYFGSYTNDKFGQLECSFMTQFYLPKLAVDVQKIIEDSVYKVEDVTLQLAYSVSNYGVFGTTPKNVQHIQIYELQEKLDDSKTYYNNTDVNDFIGLNPPIYDSIINVVPNMLATTGYDVGTAYLHVKLPAAYFNKFLSTEQGRLSLFSDESLLAFFKGLCIKSNNTNQIMNVGNIAGFDLKNDITKLVLRYKNKNNELKRIDFRVATGCRRVNVYKSTINENLVSLKSDNENIYIQGFGSSIGKIYCKLNNIFDKSSPIAIIKAELEIPVNEEWSGSDILNYPYPAKLRMWYIDKNGSIEVLKDQGELDGFGPNGSYDNIKKNYTFNISRTLQHVINTNEDIKGFLIACDNRSNIPRKVVLKTGNNIKLKIKYTKF